MLVLTLPRRSGAVLPVRQPLGWLAALLLLPLAGHAQLTVTSLNPARNAIAAPRAANLGITFDQAVGPATAGNVRVFSNQRGGQLVRGGNTTVSGSTLSVNPATDLRPGETVQVTVPATVTSSGGTAATKHVYQFTAATGGTGRGNFNTGSTAPTGASVSASALADINADGNLDLLTASSIQPDGAVNVHFGDGSGTFVAAAATVTVARLPYALKMADIDNDGDLDMLVAAAGSGSGTLSVRINDGTGTFAGTGPLDVNITLNALANAIAVGDVDGDGDLDVLLNNFSPFNNLDKALLLRNPGTGAFAAITFVPVGNATSDVVLGDVDNDGDLDLLTTTYYNVSPARVSIQLNDGSGTFGAKTDLNVGVSPYRLTLADLNADGRLDLISGTAGTGNFSVCLSTGAATFGTPNVLSTNDSSPYRPAAADVDADGDLDLVVVGFGSSFLRLFLNDGTASFGTPTAYQVEGNSNDNLVGDLDNDGDVDLVTVGSQTIHRIDVRLNAPLPNAAPTALALSNTAIDENTGANAVVGTFSTTDADAGNTFIYTLVSGTGSTDNALVNLSGSTLRITASPDFETKASYAIRVRTTDQGNLFKEQTFVITINDLFESNDLTVSTPQNVSGSYDNVIIVDGGIATLTGPLTVSGALSVEQGGELNTNCQPITGAGSFTLTFDATLRICSPQGISATGATGAIQLTGTRVFDADATYVYNGTAAQVTGPALPTTVQDLEIDNAAGVTLSQPTSIAVVVRLTSGALITGGQLTLRSRNQRGRALTAYAVHAGGTTSGNVTVQRYVGGDDATPGYRHLSSPVQAAPVSDLTTAGFTAKVNPAYNALPDPALPASQFPTVFGYDEARGGAPNTNFNAGYFSPAALNTPLTPGRGYSVYITGNKTPDFVGALTTGNVSVALSLTGNPATNGKAGWHLVGNPYPQPIDWDLLTVPAGIDASAYVWYSADGVNGAYRVRNATTQLGNLEDGLIGLGQGFFVRRNASVAGSVNLPFTNTLRVEANLALGRPAPAANAARPRLTLALANANASAAPADEVTVYLDATATLGYDGAFDAARPGRNVGVPTLSALIGGQEAMLSALPAAVLTSATETVVELTAVLPAPGTYTLAVGTLVNFGATSVTLLDRLTNTRYDLTQQPTVSLTATRANEEVTGRFAVVFNGQRVLGTSQFTVHSSPFTVHPNPTAVGGSVRVTGCPGSLPVAVLDLAGRRVATAVADASGVAELNTQTLAAGTYVVRAADGRTTRLVVQ